MKLSWQQTQDWLAIALLVLAPFSFAPSVALPVFGFTSFRVGFYQLLLATFVLLTLWLQRRLLQWQLLSNRWLQLGVSGLLLLLVNSLLVTLNTPRTLLLGVSIGLLAGASLAMYVYVGQLGAGLSQFMKRAGSWIVGVGAVVAAIGIVQFIVGSVDQTLVADGLCEGCRGGIFGFPRINGFAIEPQFFANALLPALLVTLASQRRGQVFGARGWATSTLIVTAFALSFSRGANLALAAAVIILVVQLVRFGKAKQLVKIGVVLVAGYLLAATMMIGSNYLQFHDENPDIVAETFETLVEHGSAGIVELDVRSNQKLESTHVNSPRSAVSREISSTEPFAPPQQIEASGDERLAAAETGVSFLDNWRRRLLGVGFGNLGPYAVSQNESLPSDLTIYIQYALVLVEAGVVGLVLFVAVHAAAVWCCLKQAAVGYPTQVALGAIMVAFMVQYFFYGTYINAAYIWVYLGLALALSAGFSEKVLQSQPQ